MKIALYQPNQFHTNSTNASIPVKNSFPKIKQLNMDIVSFGHYLDDEKSEQESALRRVEASINSVKDDISKENRDHDSAVSSLNGKIRDLKAEVKATSNEIDTLKDESAKKDTKIKKIKSNAKSLEKDVKSGKKKVEQLQAQHKEILKGITDDAELATKTRDEKLGQQAKQIQKIHTQEMENAVMSIKNKLIQNVINPTIQKSEGDNVRVPSGILLESDSNDVAKKVFEWIMKKTGSNYAIIDAQEFQNKSGLTSLINHISKRAKIDFDSSQVRTFTLIENFDSFIPSQDEKNDSAFKSFKEFLSKCSEFYNNTVVAVTKPGIKPDEINGLNFNVKLKLDSTFMQDKRLGYDAIFNELKTIKALSKNLLFSAFELLH